MSIQQKFTTVCAIALLCIVGSLKAQLTVIPSSTSALLTAKLTGPGITIISDTLICNTQANGTFRSVSTPIALDSGIILSTGRSALTAGTEPGATSTSFAGAGDADFTSALLGTTSVSRDGCALIINFVPKGDTVRFNYQFGSEEYINSTCGPYNDAFAFWISGPGISSSLPGVNMALVPGTTIPITVNSVNSGTPCGTCSISTCNAMGSGSPFTSFYINNSGGTAVSYRGYTRVLQAKHWVIPCDTYRIKMAIVDAANYLYDSGVFIEAGSLKSNTYHFDRLNVLGSTIGGVSNTLVKGCADDTVHMKSNYAVSFPTKLYLSYGGTATAGVDYTRLPDSVTLAAGDTVTSMLVHALTGSTTGPKTLFIYLSSSSTCGIIDTITINILDEPNVNMITRDTTICAGSPLRILATGTPGLTYSWTPATFLDNPAILNPTATPTTTITYTLTATLPGSPCGNVVKTITITTMTPAISIATPDTTICQGSSFTIRVNGADSLQYIWTPAIGLSSPIDKLPIASPTVTTTYSVTATFRRLGCPVTEDIAVTVIPTDFTITTKDTAICAGNTLLLNATVMPPSAGYTYLWSGPMGYSSILLNPVITTVSGDNAGVYTLVVTTGGLCSKSAVEVVQVNPSPSSVILAPPIEYCQFGPSRPIVVQGYNNIMWFSSAIDSTPSVVAPYPPTDTLGRQRYYAAQISFDNNCVGQKFPVDINVVSCCNGPIYVPNAFSPNNDGLNDVFKVNKNNDYAISQFEVFDRWGNSIFLSTSNTPYWDGTYMGKPSDIGTYFYIVRANCIGGKMDEIVLKGTVSLVR